MFCRTPSTTAVINAVQEMVVMVGRTPAVLDGRDYHIFVGQFFFFFFFLGQSRPCVL